jgi:phosphoacetylglucosamine mutase
VRIALGQDTRPSGPELVEAVKAGIKAVCPDAEIIDLGRQTTPQFHFAVSLLTQNVWTPTAYMDQFVNAFKELLASIHKEPQGHLIIDCANGIGAVTAQALKAELASSYSALQVTLINDGSQDTDVLNSECGADFVKMNQKPPKGAQNSAGTAEARIATFDGDADRLLYLFFDRTSGAFQLLDGDKIATLFVLWLKKLLKSSELACQLSLGVVQTAYANGASTHYIRKVLQVPVEMACTGVKNLHHTAQEKFDIAIYFEANGHGTVLFSEKALNDILGAAQEGNSDAQTLLLLTKLINQCIGDALCDMLVVEAALLALDLDLSAWTSLYTDLPNIQIKAQVPNRSIYRTTDADTRLSEPLGIQEQVDAAVAGIELGRAFVRPSGTEDVVRVYAEAATAKDCEKLANAIAKSLI